MVDDAKETHELNIAKESAKEAKSESPKIKKELSVISLPHDNDVMAQEMAELFDEDRVTHRHGGSEPEKD